MSIEAMKQALEALERSVSTCFDRYAHEQVMSRPEHFINQTITTLRAAIEQAEKQEPVAWANINKHGDITHTNNKRMPWSKTPLYTTPPAAQPEQEQVAWKHDCAALLQNDVELWIDRCPHCGKPRTTPPAAQRTWVGLTDEEYLEIIVSHKDPIEFCRDIEQRLKEKNT